MNDLYRAHEGAGPLVAVALHAGHAVRPSLRPLLAIPEATRLREEDPYTDRWTAIAPTRVRVLRSRFEVDLNRPREGALYLDPEQSWGLRVWRESLPDAETETSLALHDEFYRAMAGILDRKAEQGPFVVYDIHSYNHRREGPNGPEAPGAENPEVNLGTGSMDERWRPVGDAFLGSLSDHDFRGRRLDVRENVRFRGGHFPAWVHDRYPGRGCALAIEVKKFFMDEWTGVAHRAELDAVREALAATREPVVAALEEVA